LSTIAVTGLNALSYAFILFLVAAGFSLIFGVMGFLNLAHGAMYMIAAYIGVQVVNWFHSFWVALLIAVIALAILGFGMYTIFLRRLYGDITAQCLLTTGIAMCIANICLWVWGPYAQIGETPSFLKGGAHIAGMTFPVYRIFIICIGLVVLAGLWWMQDRTRVGAIIRAGMDDKEMTVGLGINYGTVSTAVFVGGAALVGAAGVLGSPILGTNITIGDNILLLSFLVVCIGGTGFIQGTMLGALVVGFLDMYGQVYLKPVALYLSYLIFLLVLLIRPTGLLGRKAITSDVQVSANLGPPPIKRLPAPGWLTAAPAVLLGVILLVLPLFIPSFVRNLVTETMVLSIFIVSMAMLWGYAGMWTFGHAAFFGAGAYACGILILHAGISNFWLNLLLALVFVGVLAAILGVAALRVFPVGAIDNPTYFILTTMAFGEILSRIAISQRTLTGGSTGLAGIPQPSMGFGIKLTMVQFYYLVFIFAVVTIYVMYRIVCSRYGHGLRGVQSNERRLLSLGFNTWRYKYTAWIIAALFAGIGGVLYAYWAGVLIPSNLGMATSQIAYLAATLGGYYIFFGPIVGTILYVALWYMATLFAPVRWPLILGVIFILVIMFMRQGVSDPMLRQWNRFVLRVSGPRPSPVGAGAEAGPGEALSPVLAVKADDPPSPQDEEKAWP
jgi:branched-chain amino acid transport system permease protein